MESNIFLYNNATAQNQIDFMSAQSDIFQLNPEAQCETILAPQYIEGTGEGLCHIKFVHYPVEFCQANGTPKRTLDDPGVACHSDIPSVEQWLEFMLSKYHVCLRFADDRDTQ